MPNPGKLRVYMDGGCGLCQFAQSLIEPYDSARVLEFVDYNDPEVRAGVPFPVEELGARMHVEAPDGSWHKGFFGWIAIMAALPELRDVAWMLGLPPFVMLGPVAYDLIAANRNELSSALLALVPACESGCGIEPHAAIAGGFKNQN